MKQIGFVGDIHGQIDDLTEVVEAVASSVERLVFLGDYVNRGSRSREVIDYLIDLPSARGFACTYLLGHHDEAFLDALKFERLDAFLRTGGAATLSSYIAEPAADLQAELVRCVPVEHIGFLESLARSTTVNGVFAAHERQQNRDIHADLRFAVYGHWPQRSKQPSIREHEAFIDTGCGTWPDGRLTCLMWPSLDWVQSKV